jgi:hypothetical protein
MDIIGQVHFAQLVQQENMEVGLDTCKFVLFVLLENLVV